MAHSFVYKQLTSYGIIATSNWTPHSEHLPEVKYFEALRKQWKQLTLSSSSMCSYTIRDGVLVFTQVLVLAAGVRVRSCEGYQFRR